MSDNPPEHDFGYCLVVPIPLNETVLTRHAESSGKSSTTMFPRSPLMGYRSHIDLPQSPGLLSGKISLLSTFDDMGGCLSYDISQSNHLGFAISASVFAQM